MGIEKGAPEATPGTGPGVAGSTWALRLVRPVVLLSWVLAAVVAGSVVWWAVAAIGGEQGAARGKVYTQAQVAELTVPSPAGVASTPADPQSAGSAATPTPVPTSPVGDPGPTPTAMPVPPAATSTAPPDPVQPSPDDVARTWNVAGGQVGAQCRGAQIALLYATPLDGWTVEVKHGGPAELEVKFRQGESETSVHGACVDGVPAMVAEADDD